MLFRSVGDDFWIVAEYAPTSAYQVASKLNMGSFLPEGRYEFGSVVKGDRSLLVARRSA